MTRLVIGLGNPGPEYADTRHNVGFRVLDRLALHEGLLFQPAKKLERYTGPGAFQWARSFEPDGLLLKPETFMNRSGDVALPVARFLETPAESILVVYDDLDLEPFRLRLRPHGGAGGHNGMRSLIDRLGTDRFPRLRIGIGRGRTDVKRYVLEPFPDDRSEELEVAVAEAADAVLAWLGSGDIEHCMTTFHRRWSDAAEH